MAETTPVPESQLQQRIFREKDVIRALWFEPKLSSPQNQKFVEVLYDTFKNRDFELHLCTTIDDSIKTLNQDLFKWWKIITCGSEGRGLIKKIEEFGLGKKHFLTLIVYCPNPKEHHSWAIECRLTLGVQAILGAEKVATNSQRDIMTYLQMSPNQDKLFQLVSDPILPKISSFPDFSVMIKKATTGGFLKDLDVPKNQNQIQNNNQNRKQRFVQYVLPMKHIPTQLANCLFCPDSTLKSNSVSTILGILVYAKLKGYPPGDIFSKLVTYSIMDTPATISDSLVGWTLMGAYTEECFLYKDLNKALAECDFTTLKRLRWFVKMLYITLMAKTAPYYAGVVYRAVNMGEDIDMELYSPGSNIFFATFASTTKNLTIAQEWGCDTLFEIHTCDAEYQEKNTFCHTNIDLKDVTSYPKEEEVLYPPFSMFQVSGVEQKYGTRVIVLKESTGAAWNFLYCHLQFGLI